MTFSRRSLPFAAFAVALATTSLPFARVVTAQRPRVEWSGVPAVNFDADEGFGYGLALAAYRYDTTNASYRWTLQPTVFLTTAGRRDYTLFFDAPSQSDRPWRYTADIGRQEQLAAPYYGVGNDTPYDPRLEVGSTRYYYRYGRNRLRATLDVQHALWRPELRLLVGVGASDDRINLTPFDSGTTLISQQLAGIAPAVGHTNYVRTGITWDSRDREIGTHSGTWADFIIQRVDARLDATKSYTRWTATARHYQPFGDRLTFANRLLLQNTIGNAPFYVLSEVQSTQQEQDGLGGAGTLRGLPKDRYVGDGMFVSNNELRWRATDFRLAGRASSLVLSTFVDAGRVWTSSVDLSTIAQGLHIGDGLGARLAFGSSFVIAADVGHSAQSTAPVYIGLGYLF